MSACATCGAETVQVRRKDADAVILDAKPLPFFAIFDNFNDTIANATDVRGARGTEYLDQCDARLVAVWREHKCAGTVSTTSAARAAGEEDTVGRRPTDAGSSPAPRSEGVGW